MNDTQADRSGARTNGAAPGNVPVSETNLIRTCLEKHLDNESYAKLQQVLEFLGDSLYVPLYKEYNQNLRLAIQEATTTYGNLLSDGYSLMQFTSMKMKLYAFRFITNIGRYLIGLHAKGYEKAEENVIALIKVLLYHGLVAKSDTANLALVELEQTCKAFNLTLPELYQRYRLKILRLIIKAILYKLITTQENGSNSSESSNERSSYPIMRTNCVVGYMTRAFEIFNVATITKEDIAQSLVITTNLIHKHKYDNAIRQFLEYLAKYQNIDVHTLIRTHIQTIIVSLLLRRKLSQYDTTYSLDVLGKFCDKDLPELIANKFAHIKGRLLLHISINPRVVTDALYYLTKFEKNDAERPLEGELEDDDCLINYLNPSIIGILLGVDSYFNSNADQLCSELNISHIGSLTKLISLFDTDKITKIHHKLLSTLSNLVKLRPRRDNLSLNKALIELWTIFIKKLDEKLKVSLVINLCVALYDLIDECPQEVSELYSQLINVSDAPDFLVRLKCLFFIPNSPGFSRIYEQLTPYVGSRETSLSTLNELSRALDCTLPLMEMENSKCHLLAVKRIRDLFKSNRQLLVSNMLVNPDEPLDTTLSTVIEKLLALSSTQDSDCLLLIAECLGVLGAINPVRLQQVNYGKLPDNRIGSEIWALMGTDFLAGLIERLKNSLFSDRRSESEAANYALQVVTKVYRLTSDSNQALENERLRETTKDMTRAERNRIFMVRAVREGITEVLKARLSAGALRACDLCKNTSYMGEERVPPDVTIPVYTRFKNENQYSYKDWLDKFSLVLLSFIDDSDTKEILTATTYLFKHNLKLAEYILPAIAIHILLHQLSSIEVIRNELMAIILEDVGVSSQDLDSVYSEDVRNSLQTLHFQCANMVFCILDAYRAIEHDSVSQNSIIKLEASHITRVKEFNASIPLEKLALLASKCRAHARALYYFDQYFLENKIWKCMPNDPEEGFKGHDKCWAALQKVYVALDDSHEAMGVDIIRDSLPTTRDEIANYESAGRFDRAFARYNNLLDKIDNSLDKGTLIEDALKCLSSQGDHQRLYDKTRRMMCDHPQFKRSILPAAIEACTQLGRWDELNHTLKSEQIESLLDQVPVSQGYLLTSLIQSRDDVPDKLNIVRTRLMKPLSIAMIDRSAYFRGYQNLLVMHSIEDFALALSLLRDNEFSTPQIDENTADVMRRSLETKLDTLFDTWNKRNKLVQPSLWSLEPLLSWQRSISQSILEKYPFIESKISSNIAPLWLASANASIDAGYFDRAFYSLNQAHKWFGGDIHKLSLDVRVKYTIGCAKLDWEQGEQNRAISGLKVALRRLRDHKLYKHLETRRNSMEASRLLNDTGSRNPFPDIFKDHNCLECNQFDQSDRESFAQVMILLTRYCEEATATGPEQLLHMYEECVHLAVNQEEIYVRLARYYDKLANHYLEAPETIAKLNRDDLSSSASKSTKKRSNERTRLSDRTSRDGQNKLNKTINDDSFFDSGDEQPSTVLYETEDYITTLWEQSILAFSKSLKYGVRFLEESMPRMLNIWFDLGSMTANTRISRSRMDKAVRCVDALVKDNDVPTYYFMSATSIILSRVCHPHHGISSAARAIIERLLRAYPHQMSWLMVAMSNDENKSRQDTFKVLVQATRKTDMKVLRILKDTIDFSKVICSICKSGTSYDPKVSNRGKRFNTMTELYQLEPKIIDLHFSKISVIAPVQKSIRPILPTESDCNNLVNYNVYPRHNINFVRGFEPRARIYNSLMQPRQIGLKCDDGRVLNILCKAGDDLRKDSRCIEFFNLLNRVLRRRSQSSARFFEIPTFLVLPLESHAGIIEMLPNCETFRAIVEGLYKEKFGKSFNMQEGLVKRSKSTQFSNGEVYRQFIKKVLPRVSPPVFYKFFTRKFSEPTSWYMARLAYVRSTAVISIGGYIIGLGDRHCDNILIDVNSGRVVHVDFNLLFHQGETLPCPEIVPFRLTHNIISAFGLMGIEGNFRKNCEITMKVMRDEKEALITTLKPFIFDPCSEWIKDKDNRGSAGRSEGNKDAKAKVGDVERKLKGFPRSREAKPLSMFNPYTVEVQVDNLISDASSMYNISQMYFGWLPLI